MSEILMYLWEGYCLAASVIIAPMAIFLFAVYLYEEHQADKQREMEKRIELRRAMHKAEKEQEWNQRKF